MMVSIHSPRYKSNSQVDSPSKKFSSPAENNDFLRFYMMVNVSNHVYKSVRFRFYGLLSELKQMINYDLVAVSVEVKCCS